MLRRGQINGDRRGRSLRFLRAIPGAAAWPFERAAWSLERRLLWPLRERLAGWSPPAHRFGAAALAAAAVAAILVGVLVLAGDDTSRQQAAAPARVAIATPEPQPQPADDRPDGPVLHGAAPSFHVADGVGLPGGADPEAAGDNPSAAPSAEAAAEAPPSEEGGATSSSAKPVPAGPAAMRVARRFSEAFVFYEIGQRPARSKTVFGETATPDLATALGERPPRLPADARVPKARVLNLVPGPRAGKAYTVSVSLLRVGLTSELRLELARQHGKWLVTDVKG